MLDTLFWIGVGVVIGWNVLPQPAWAKVLWDQLMEKYKGN